MCWGDWRNMLLDVPEGRFSGLSAGHGYACAVRGDSAVVCWGAFSPPGENGGENAGSFTRVSVGDPRSWERFHACALGADGNVMCWDQEGRHPTRRGSHIDVSVGDAHACALRASGDVECWRFINAQIPWEDLPYGIFVQISSEGTQTCGVREDTTAACWGYVPEGPDWRAFDPGWRGFTEVSASFEHACGLREDGDEVTHISVCVCDDDGGCVDWFE